MMMPVYAKLRDGVAAVAAAPVQPASQHAEINCPEATERTRA